MRSSAKDEAAACGKCPEPQAAILCRDSFVVAKLHNQIILLESGDGQRWIAKRRIRKPWRQAFFEVSQTAQRREYPLSRFFSSPPLQRGRLRGGGIFPTFYFLLSHTRLPSLSFPPAVLSPPFPTLLNTLSRLHPKRQASAQYEYW